MEAPLVVYQMDPIAAKVMEKEYRAAVVAAVIEVVPVGLARGLKWGRRSIYPMIAEWGKLKELRVGGLERVTELTREIMFKDETPATMIEKGDGIMPGMSRGGEARGRVFSSAELAAIFNEQIMPAQLQPSSRANYWGGWRQILTFGLAHGVMDRLLPMNMEELRAVIMEMMMVGASAGTIKNVMSAVENRHRMAGLDPPLMAPMAFKRLYKAVASVAGAPSRMCFPVGKHHLRSMLRLAGPSQLERRAILVTVLGTVCVSRPQEVSHFQCCDLLWGHDGPYHSSLKDGLAIRVYKRKQDTGRFGLYVRVPAGMLVESLKSYVTDMNLRVDPRCTKVRLPGGRCKYCDPVFTRTVVGRTAREVGIPAKMSRQQISGAVKVAMESLGLDARYYSGKSMRRGGVTAAVQAKIPAAVLYRQSGHGTATSAAQYMDPVDPRMLYDTGKAMLGSRPL